MPHNLTILLGFDSPYDYGRNLYRQNDCGPFVEIVCWDGTRWPSDEVQFVHFAAGSVRLTWEDFKAITAIGVGCIIEGSDLVVGPYDVPILPVDTFHLRMEQTLQMLEEASEVHWRENKTIERIRQFIRSFNEREGYNAES